MTSSRVPQAPSAANPLPEALVSAAWLRDHLGAPGLIVLDARVGKRVEADGTRSWRSGAAAFATAGHIPGARFADLTTAFSDPDTAFPFTRPGAAAFARAAGALGIHHGQRVVVYDDDTGIWAARLWWLFRAYGHDTVAVLDGGLAAWTATGGGLETGSASVAPASFTAVEHPGFFVETEEVAAIAAGRQPGTLVCVLRPPVFAGLEQVYARPGHIPGSLNLPHGTLLDAENRFLKEPTLNQRLSSLREAEPPIILYCGSGITAAGTALALTLTGIRDIAVYDGSLSAWSANPALPLITLPFP